MSLKTKLSIVIPVYNSSEIFPELYKRLSEMLMAIDISHEIIAVVDGCSDNSADIIAEFCEKDSHLKLVEFSRNFGHQAAISAGLEYSCGEMVVIIDDDLEDPPELVPEFIAKAQEGFDVVYGIRKRRKVSLFRIFSFHIFYRVLNRITDMNMPYDAGDFCLMKRKVVERLNSMPETNRYLRGMRGWLGFRQTGIEYERDVRFKGESGYSFAKYIKLALDGIFSFSYKPLKFVSIMGFIIASLSFIFGIRLIILKILDKVRDVPGWASLMVTLLFIGGFQLIAIGIVGQYIARIFDEVKHRPKFIVKREIGFEYKEK